MVFIKMLQTKMAINASLAIRNDFIWPKFLYKSHTMQPCLSNYTIARAVQLETIVLYCRRNAKFLVHTSPPRKFSECAARFLIRPGQRQEIDRQIKSLSDKGFIEPSQSPYGSPIVPVIFRKPNGQTDRSELCVDKRAQQYNKHILLQG